MALSRGHLKEWFRYTFVLFIPVMAADKCEEEDDIGSTSGDSFIHDSDNDEPSISGHDEDEEIHHEAPLTDEDIEGLIAELLTVESKAAEAQEALEDESLAKVEVEVREELAQTIEGEALDSAVADEMLALREKWEDELDDLEKESAHLLEQLDVAGIELPSLYKWIEIQAPNGCCTEAWKNRTHWVGSQATGVVTESIADAEKYLQTHRPVRRWQDGWVEEIDDIEGNPNDPFVADAIVTERQLYKSEDNKKFRKVKEEDDVNHDRKLLYRLNQKRRRRKIKQEGMREVEEHDVSNGIAYRTPNTDHKTSSDLEMRSQKSNGLCGSKRPSDGVELSDSKKGRNVNADSSDVEPVAVDRSASSCSDSGDLDQSDQQENGDSTDDFQCTACDKVADDVYTHPLLKVIVCRNCKYRLQDKLKETDPDCAECFCGWCGRSGDLLSCRSCKNLFCTSCIKKNLGEECLLKARDLGWQCCCCSPSILQPLTLQLEKAFTSRSESSSSSDSDSESSDDLHDGFKVPISKRRRKKKIRRILDDAELGEDTKRKIAIEKVFILFLSVALSMQECDAQTGYIVNVVREEKEEAVRLPQSISTKLKSHQVAGIRFMWENIIQSITKVRSGDKGLGCILAHTMGLGKTLQVIAFLYAAMRSVDIGLRAAMIVTPVNVLHNWRHEFTKWRPTEFKPLRVYMLEDVPRYGQTKPVFAYRLMAHGTMEEKIYKRQVTKESLSARVVDRQQVHRTISKEEMLHLFAFGDDENLNTSKMDQVSSNLTAAQSNSEAGNSSKQKGPLPHTTVSSDKFMEALLKKHHPRWIANYHEHESLLQENEDEKLSKEEQDMAWEVYRRTLEWEEVQRNPTDGPGPGPGLTSIPKPTVNGASEVAPPFVVNVARKLAGVVSLSENWHQHSIFALKAFSRSLLLSPLHSFRDRHRQPLSSAAVFTCSSAFSRRQPFSSAHAIQSLRCLRPFSSAPPTQSLSKGFCAEITILNVDSVLVSIV
ncbi:hypothetical protein L1987_65168 [Smallanthus sonchifolius]|uniref:Uncharacterized protein n=1 Tax=Smallanthus sonchifolius TaxID=185202 RepID=A0ACB9BTP5_9ASTR|nr:hypothetical protein L1987_65168 [Smallanthus sonchifolius]